MKKELGRYIEEVRALTRELEAMKEENRQLRESAETFGALAERLNSALRQRRRSRDADDYRVSPRDRSEPRDRRTRQ